MELLSKLAQARIERDWTQAYVAESIGVEIITVCRWEKGSSQPYPRHVKKLCDLFGKAAAELGLAAFETPVVPFPGASCLEEDKAFARYFQGDLELRLQCLMYDWRQSSKPSRSYALLQHRLTQELEDDDSMTNEPNQNHNEVDLGRRDALRRLALLPIHVLSLDALGTAPSRAPEEILTNCAAGMTACHYLAKGEHDDMNLAYSVLSTYLTPLKEIVEQSSLHRKEAARLVGQALRIKATLSVHREGPKRAVNYGKQAEIYSKESGDASLLLITLQQLAWFYSCDKQSKQALETALRARHLLEHAAIPLSPLIQSAVYGAVAKYQAQNRQREEALAALHTAYETFPSEDDEDSTFVDFNRSTLILRDGLAHYYLGEYEAALDSFSQAIDPHTLDPKVPASSARVRIEIINYQTLASLKIPKREKELTLNLWMAGMKGALALRSEQRFNEALIAYEIMEALWPDPDVKALRDVIKRW